MPKPVTQPTHKEGNGAFNTFFRELVLESSDAIIAVGRNHHIIFNNRAAETLFGYDGSELLSQPLDIVLPERFRAGHGAHLKKFLSSNSHAKYMGDRHSHVVGLRADGTEIPLGASILIVEMAGEQVMVATLRDISSRLDLQNQLTRLANIDPLTGALNRRAFIEAADKECRRAIRYSTGFSILVFDLDSFKNINDKYGHDVGDIVLCSFSELVRSSLRETDLFARWGGEEFIVALPNSHMPGARQTAERIREAMGKQRFNSADGRQLSVTVSVGVSASPPAAIKRAMLSELIKCADVALYEAKKAGRNKVLANVCAAVRH